jgi:hypothetical protein
MRLATPFCYEKVDWKGASCRLICLMLLTWTLFSPSDPRVVLKLIPLTNDPFSPPLGQMTPFSGSPLTLLPFWSFTVCWHVSLASARSLRNGLCKWLF